MVETTTIDALLNVAVRYELYGVDFIRDFDYATLCREYNGIGPEWAGAPIREKTTKWFSLFEPAALIHDMRNYMSDGRKEAFDAANLEFLANCRKLANAAYPWYSWRRYRARFVAHLLYDFVDGPGGWMAWRECWEKRKERIQGDGASRSVV